MLRTWWQKGPVYYEQKTVLTAAVKDLNDVALDTPTILLMQIRVVNVSDAQNGTAAATLWLDRGRR